MLSPFFKLRRIITIFKELFINEQIRAKEVRLLDENGENKVVSIEEALAKAEEKGLDLVLMSTSGKPPVCKLMDYGKYKFDSIKREKELKKNQKIAELK